MPSFTFVAKTSLVSRRLNNYIIDIPVSFSSDTLWVSSIQYYGNYRRLNDAILFLKKSTI